MELGGEPRADPGNDGEMTSSDRLENTFVSPP